MKIYLACSFAYEDRELTQTRKTTMGLFQNHLTDLGHEVYNPSQLKIENAWDYSMYDWGNLVFQADKKAIDDADLIIFISHGKENNAGSVWEVGYAYALGKKIIMISMNENSPESLMVIHSCHACLKGVEEFWNYDFDNMPKKEIDCVES